MSFGLNIFNSAGKEISEGSRNVFVMDYFEVTGAGGSKNYPLDPGEKLQAFVLPDFGTPGVSGNYYWGITGISVSGGTVSYSATLKCYFKCYVIVVKSGVV